MREESSSSLSSHRQHHQHHHHHLQRSNEKIINNINTNNNYNTDTAALRRTTRRRFLSTSPGGPGATSQQSSQSMAAATTGAATSAVTRNISSTSTQPTTAKSLLEFGFLTKGPTNNIGNSSTTSSTASQCAKGQYAAGGKNILPLEIVLHPTAKTLMPIIGNVAYVAIASGFLMTDMLELRIMLIGGYTGLVAFHTLHERPLRIPLRWSGLFVLLNAGAAAMLIADRYAPSLNSDPNFAQDGEDLYEEHFASMLTRGQCQQLFRLAERRQIPAGTILTKENIPSEHMFFLVKGQAHVYHGKTNVLKDDENSSSNNNSTDDAEGESNIAPSPDVWFYNSIPRSATRKQRNQHAVPPPPPHYTHNIATIEQGGFVNDVAFQQEQQKTHRGSKKTTTNATATTATATSGIGAYGTVITTKDSDVLIWDTTELRQHLASRPDMEKNMMYCLSNHLVKSLMRQREAAHKRQQQHHALRSTST